MTFREQPPDPKENPEGFISSEDFVFRLRKMSDAMNARRPVGRPAAGSLRSKFSWFGIKLPFMCVSIEHNLKIVDRVANYN
jgi:hypothetical protein